MCTHTYIRFARYNTQLSYFCRCLQTIGINTCVCVDQDVTCHLCVTHDARSPHCR